jgi:hypothetical protein
MLVVMALVTTLMTSPFLNWLGIEDRSAKNHDMAPAEDCPAK